jgi:hypothetical protein
VQKEDAMAIAQLTRAFEIAQERVRICRKTPLPGVVKHEAKPKRGKHAQVLVLEPMSEAGESSDSAGNQPDTQDDKQGESAGVQAS